LTATVTNLAGTKMAIKNASVVATLPIVRIFAQPTVLTGTRGIMASTAADTGQLYDWTLQGQTAAPILTSPTDTATLTYDSGSLTGFYGLMVSVTDAEGRTGTDSLSVPVVENAFVKDPRDPGSRSLHTATLLQDGRVLVVVGDGGVPDFGSWPVFGSLSYIVGTIDVFDPATETWAMVTTLQYPRSEHAAVLLKDGRVLIVGGTGTGGSVLASAEIYDPTQRWSMVTSDLTVARSLPVATLLADGRVLVTGGVNANGAVAEAEVYDPVAGVWSSAGNMAEGRVMHSATVMLDGEVLVAGGRGGNVGQSTILNSAETYDPIANTWRPAAPTTTNGAGPFCCRPDRFIRARGSTTTRH